MKVAAKEGAGPIFKLSDNLRDEVLPNLGIKLEDKKDVSSWMFVSKEELMREKEAIAAEKAAKEAIKA